MSMSSISSASSQIIHAGCDKCVASKNPVTQIICELFSEKFDAPLRELILTWLNPRERDLCFQVCDLGIQWSLSQYQWDPREGLNPLARTENTIREILVEKMQSVVTDYQRRSIAYKGNLKVLDQGFWYTNDYYQFLQEKNQTKRISFFRDKGVFFHGRPPLGFVAIEDPTSPSGKMADGYRLNSPTLPSEGLKNVWGTLCFLECMEGVELAYYGMLLEIWGRTQFDRIFRADGETPLSFSPKSHQTPLARYMTCQLLPDGERGTRGMRPVQSGDSVGFANIPAYRIRHPQGEWAGFNMLCAQHTPEQQFLGFGGPNEGITERRVLELLAEAFNQKTLTDEELYTEELVKSIAATDRGFTHQLPPGMTKELLIKILGEKILDAEEVGMYAGFSGAVLSPNIKAIQAVGQKKSVTPTSQTSQASS